MDEIVSAAMRKWPNVPNCHGWLALDARGDWYMRDERAQAAGPFPHPKGSRIEHARLREFIERNYARDDAGGWYFQNGPQRVYVDLEAAPWVWRLHADTAAPGGVALVTHTGLPARAGAVWLDESGRLFVDSERGTGLVHTQDMGLAADAVERGSWVPEPVRSEALPRRGSYLLRPRPAAA